MQLAPATRQTVHCCSTQVDCTVDTTTKAPAAPMPRTGIRNCTMWRAQTAWAPCRGVHTPEPRPASPSSAGLPCAMGRKGKPAVPGACMRSRVTCPSGGGAPWSRPAPLPATAWPGGACWCAWCQAGAISAAAGRAAERWGKKWHARSAARFSAMSSSSAALLERAENTSPGVVGTSQGAALADDRRERAPAGDVGRPPYGAKPCTNDATPATIKQAY
uniref:Uncharacterized protein n=1 Tax=Aegilops tauschii subsp. strangulata TaxID=200361 RepID=A0A453CPV6_AEGTS